MNKDDNKYGKARIEASEKKQKAEKDKNDIGEYTRDSFDSFCNYVNEVRCTSDEIFVTNYYNYYFFVAGSIYQCSCVQKTDIQ